MNWFWVLLAIFIPWISCSLLIRYLWPDHIPGRWPLALGYGFLFGVVGTTLILRLQAALGMMLNTWFSLSIFLFIGLVGIILIRFQQFLDFNPKSTSVKPINWRNLAFSLLLVWLILRFTNLAFEIWLQPIISWDAWTTWAARARTWSMLRELVPFVSQERWATDNLPGLYTIDAHQYPLTVSLIATWLNLAYGTWNESLANLPWLGASLALGLGFYGQARIWGASQLTALIFTWLLLSLPILNIHIAIAGYADIWVGVALALGVMAFLGWIRFQEKRQGLLAFLALVATSMMKREAVIWVGLMIPALLVIRLRPLWLITWFLVITSLLFILWLNDGIQISTNELGYFGIGLEKIQINGIGEIHFSYHSVWKVLLHHLFIYSNWHIFPYLFILALSVTITNMLTSKLPSWQIASLTWLLLSLATLYILFFWTHAYIWVLEETIPNRLILQLTPAIFFWIMAVLLENIQPPILYK